MYLSDVLCKNIKTSWGESMNICYGIEPAVPDEVDIEIITESIDVVFTVKGIDVDKFGEKLSFYLPFNKDFLLSLDQELFSSEKEIAFPEKSEEQKAVVSKVIKDFVARGNKNNFKDYLKLKTQGRDEFSSLKLEALEQKVNKDAIDAIDKERFEEKQKAIAYRWILRGLPVDMAIHKVKVDLEVQENAAKSKKKK